MLVYETVNFNEHVKRSTGGITVQKIKHKTEVLLAVSVIMTVIFIIFASFFMINTTNALSSEVDKYIDRTVTQKFEIVETT